MEDIDEPPHYRPPSTADFAVPRRRPPRVVIVGAGVAGLCVAYELVKAGYSCTLLKAAARAGGRVWTVRDGSRSAELDGTEQRARLADGMYFGHLRTDGCRRRPAPRRRRRARLRHVHLRFDRPAEGRPR